MVLVTFIVMLPYIRIDPPKTLEPISLLTGLDSPVSIASFEMPLPQVTIPSTGMP